MLNPYILYWAIFGSIIVVGLVCLFLMSLKKVVPYKDPRIRGETRTVKIYNMEVLKGIVVSICIILLVGIVTAIIATPKTVVDKLETIKIIKIEAQTFGVFKWKDGNRVVYHSNDAKLFKMDESDICGYYKERFNFYHIVQDSYKYYYMDKCTED